MSPDLLGQGLGDLRLGDLSDMNAVCGSSLQTFGLSTYPSLVGSVLFRTCLGGLGWIRPLILVLGRQFRLHRLCGVQEGSEQVHIVKVRVEILLSNLKLLELLGSIIVSGHLSELESLLEQVLGVDFDLV